MPSFERCFIMLCNWQTEQECLDRNLFGDKAKRLGTLNEIKPGDLGFLLNVERDELLGPFRAKSEAQLHIEPDAWKGRFPAQVRVETIGELKRINDATYMLSKAGVSMGQLASGMPAPQAPVHGSEVGTNLLSKFDELTGS